MADLDTLTEQTLALLYGLDYFEHPLEDTLSATLATTATSLTPATTALWKKDHFAEFPDSDEVVRFAEDSAGATDVRRAQLGTSDPGTTYAVGTVIVHNPQFYRHQIKNFIREVVRNDLWPHVWTWHKDEVTVASTDEMYDLDQYVTDVALVYQENIDANEKWTALPPGWWDVERQIDTDVATQGSMLIIRHVYDFDEPVFYTAKRRPHVDDLATLSNEIADMIPWAAAAKALAARGGQVKNAGARTARDKDGGYLQHYRGWMSEFIRMRDNLNRDLRGEVREDKRWRGPQRAFTRSW